MLERPLRILAIALSLVVAAGFLLFVLDDVGRASDDTVADISASQRTAPTAAGEHQREEQNSRGREWIDDANDVLLKPFAGITNSDSRWVERGVPALLGLLLYGFLLACLARFAHGHG